MSKRNLETAATISVLTEDEGYWRVRCEEAAELQVVLERKTTAPDSVSVQAVLIDTRGGPTSWALPLKMLPLELPVIASVESGDAATRLLLSQRSLVTVFPAQRQGLVEQVLIMLERLRARPRVHFLTGRLEFGDRLSDELMIRVRVLNTATELWLALEDEPPDVLILDTQGDEHVESLAVAVRQDARFARCILIALEGHSPLRPGPAFDLVLSQTTTASQLAALALARFRRGDAVRRLIDHDALTGLVNRRRAITRIKFLLRLCIRQRSPLALALLDLDHFKQINDQYGHATGDRVLKKVGSLLRHSFRPEDVTARVGGEEFLVAAYGSNHQNLAQRLRQCLDQLTGYGFSIQGKDSFRVSFSAGVVEFSEQCKDFQSLYEAADELLYQAKEQGRRRVVGAGF